MNSDKPSPGSDAAVEQGCTCPIMDNGHGYGYMGMKGVYVMQADCPLHGDSGPVSLAGEGDGE